MQPQREHLQGLVVIRGIGHGNKHISHARTAQERGACIGTRDLLRCETWGGGAADRRRKICGQGPWQKQTRRAAVASPQRHATVSPPAAAPRHRQESRSQPHSLPRAPGPTHSPPPESRVTHGTCLSSKSRDLKQRIHNVVPRELSRLAPPADLHRAKRVAINVVRHATPLTCAMQRATMTRACTRAGRAAECT
jgi:hypothetical protein